MQLPEGFDLEAIVRQGLKILALFFFIGVPILRSIREARKQEAEKRKAKEAAPTATPSAELDEERDGRKTWEELLRGEAVEVAPPPPPPPIPVAESRIPKAVPLFDLEQLAPKMASDENLELERRSDEEGAAEADIDRREREALRAQEEVARVQRAEGSGLRTAVAPEYRAGIDLGASADPAPVVVRKRRWRTRGDVRAAFVASEVLGAPLASRRESHLPSF